MPNNHECFTYIGGTTDLVHHEPQQADGRQKVVADPTSDVPDIVKVHNPLCQKMQHPGHAYAPFLIGVHLVSESAALALVRQRYTSLFNSDIGRVDI